MERNLVRKAELSVSEGYADEKYLKKLTRRAERRLLNRMVHLPPEDMQLLRDNLWRLYD